MSGSDDWFKFMTTTNGFTKINNTQRKAFAQLIENKTGKKRDDDDFEILKEKEMKKELERLRKKYKKEIEIYLKGKQAERKLEKVGLYTSGDEIELGWRLKEKIEAKIKSKNNHYKEKAIRDIWSVQTLEEAKKIVDDYFSLFID